MQQELSLPEARRNAISGVLFPSELCLTISLLRLFHQDAFRLQLRRLDLAGASGPYADVIHSPFRSVSVIVILDEGVGVGILLNAAR